jgi:hypothetical protein
VGIEAPISGWVFSFLLVTRHYGTLVNHEPQSMPLVARVPVSKPPQEAPPQTGEYSEAVHP